MSGARRRPTHRYHTGDHPSGSRHAVQPRHQCHRHRELLGVSAGTLTPHPRPARTPRRRPRPASPTRRASWDKLGLSSLSGFPASGSRASHPVTIGDHLPVGMDIATTSALITRRNQRTAPADQLFLSASRRRLPPNSAVPGSGGPNRNALSHIAGSTGIRWQADRRSARQLPQLGRLSAGWADPVLLTVSAGVGSSSSWGYYDRQLGRAVSGGASKWGIT